MIKIKRKKQDDKIKRLKQITRIILSNTRINEKQKTILKIDISVSEFNNYFKYKIISLFLSNLKIIKYINKHLNHLYYNVSNVDDVYNWFYTIFVICEYNNIFDVYYPRYKKSEETEFVSNLTNNISKSDKKCIFSMYVENVNAFGINTIKQTTENDIETAKTEIKTETKTTTTKTTTTKTKNNLDYKLLDIKTNGNMIYFIMTDLQNNKIIITEKIKHVIGLKYGEYKELNRFEQKENFDDVLVVNNFERILLKKELNEILKNKIQ